MIGTEIEPCRYWLRLMPFPASLDRDPILKWVGGQNRCFGHLGQQQTDDHVLREVSVRAQTDRQKSIRDGLKPRRPSGAQEALQSRQFALGSALRIKH